MTIPGGYISGDVLTAANMNLLPAGRQGSATVTSDQASIGSSSTDLTSLSVTITAVAGRKYKITGIANFVNPAGGFAYLAIIRTSTQIGLGGTSLDATYLNAVTCIAEDTPGAGSITYKLQALTSTGTMTMKGSSTNPARIIVEDIGV